MSPSSPFSQLMAQYGPKPPANTATPYNANVYTPPNIATSTVTKQPVPGSIVGATLGATAKYPSTNPTPTTLPSNQVKTTPNAVASTNTNLGYQPPPGSSGNQYSLVNGQWVLGGGSNTSTNNGNAGFNLGTALTPAQIAAQNPGATTGIGSPDPTGQPSADTGVMAAQAGSAPVTQGPGSTATTAYNPFSGGIQTNSPMGIISQLLNATGGYYGQQQGLTDQSKAILQNAAQLEGATRNQFGGASGVTVSDEAGRVQGIQNAANQGVAAIEGEQGKQAAYLSPYVNAAGTALGAETQQVQAPYGTPLFNPATGTFTSSASSGAGGGAIQNAVQSAVQMMKNGASQADAISTSGLGTFGYAGQAALAQALGPNFNPTAQAGIAAENVAQGQKYQAQAGDISNALQLIKPISDSLSTFMQQAQLDPSLVPLVNTSINKWGSQANPAAQSTMKAAIAELTNQSIALLGTNPSITPTEASDLVNSYDFSNLSPAQLQIVANNLDTLGQWRLSQAQSASSAAYGGQSGAAQGITATPGAPLEWGGANGLNNLPVPLQAIFGAMGGVFSSTASGLGSAVSNAATGAGVEAGAGVAAGAYAALFGV